jgi:hypothetical protein
MFVPARASDVGLCTRRYLFPVIQQGRQAIYFCRIPSKHLWFHAVCVALTTVFDRSRCDRLSYDRLCGESVRSPLSSFFQALRRHSVIAHNRCMICYQERSKFVGPC